MAPSLSDPGPPDSQGASGGTLEQCHGRAAQVLKFRVLRSSISHAVCASKAMLPRQSVWLTPPHTPTSSSVSLLPQGSLPTKDAECLSDVSGTPPPLASPRPEALKQECLPGLKWFSGLWLLPGSHLPHLPLLCDLEIHQDCLLPASGTRSSHLASPISGNEAFEAPQTHYLLPRLPSLQPFVQAVFSARPSQPKNSSSA